MTHSLPTRSHTATPAAPDTPPCISDPNRWTSDYDDPEAKALCRHACPRRWQCADEALRSPAARGVWAGVFLPEPGRRRENALRQLRELTIHSCRDTGAQLA